MTDPRQLCRSIYEDDECYIHVCMKLAGHTGKHGCHIKGCRQRWNDLQEEHHYTVPRASKKKNAPSVN